MMLPVMFVIPAVQLLILVYAATLEMKEIKFCVVDQDMSSVSRRLVSGFTGSPFYHFVGNEFNLSKAEEMLRAEKADLIIYIPAHFEEKMVRENSSPVQLQINAVNATKASLIYAYSSGILMDFNKEIRMEWIGMSEGMYKMINVNTSYWYNPELNFKIYILPGILTILVTLIGMFLAAINLVREKELGTAEQINVTPIRKSHFIFGKLFPFWVIGMVELAFGLIIGKVLFQLPTIGSLGLLFGYAAIYMVVVLGIGLFLSNISSSQQQVMLLTFFFMLVFELMSGIFTPVESMPDWAQAVNIINPFAYFMKVMRMILLKGSGFMDILNEIIAISIYAVSILTLAVVGYRKVN